MEAKLDTDLTDRKQEVDQLVMDYINAQSDDEDDEEDEEESEEEEKPAKRASTAKKPAAKKRRGGSSDESDDDDGGSDDDYKPKGKGAKVTKWHFPTFFFFKFFRLLQKSASKKKKADSDDSGSDAEWKKPKAKKAAKKAGGGGGGGKGKGFTRPLQLSPELASLMGCETLPRHEVVKKVWALIKERNLYDPKNKQFAICDAELQKVIGVKRFRTFGMMKYLQPHFITN